MPRYFSTEEAVKVCRQLPSNILDSSGSNISAGSEIDEQDHEPSSNSSDSDELLEDNIGNNSGSLTAMEAPRMTAHNRYHLTVTFGNQLSLVLLHVVEWRFTMS